MPAEFVQRGRSFVEQGQHQEAVRVCRLGLLANPGEIEGRLVLGAALMALARHDEVLAEMRSALDMDPANPSAMALKGEALLRKGDLNQAIAVLGQAAQAAPGDPYVENLRTEAAELQARGVAPVARPLSAPSPAMAAAPVPEPPPSHETLDIDPEVDGIEMRELTPQPAAAEPLLPSPSFHGAPQTNGSGVEMLDDSLLEEYHTPAPDPVTEEPMELHSSEIEMLPESDEHEEATRLGGPDPIGVPVTAAPPDLDEIPTTEQRALAPLPAPSSFEPVDDLDEVGLGDQATRVGGPDLGLPGSRTSALAGPSPIQAMEELESALSFDQDLTRQRSETVGQLEDDSFDIPGLTAPYDDEPSVQLRDPPTRDLRGMSHSDLAESSARAREKRPSTIDSLFPDDESGVSGVEIVDEGSRESWLDDAAGSSDEMLAHKRRAKSDDMDLIRSGIEMKARGSARGVVAPAPRPAPPSSTPEPRPRLPRPMSTAAAAPLEARRDAPAKKKRKSRRRVPVVVWLGLTAASVGGGVYGGFELRARRLAGQVEKVRDGARGLERSDTILAYRQALEMHERILGVQSDASSEASRARLQAAMAAEFGDGLDAAKRYMKGVGGRKEPQLLAAAAYLALAQGDGATALAKSDELLGREPRSATGHYLRGRALLMQGKAEEAVSALEESIAIEPRPLVYVSMARAEAERGRFPESLSAIGQALQLEESHPAALIWQAKILVMSGQLPSNPDDPDETLRELSIAARGKKGSKVSPAQGAWAGLVLAEIKLARGDEESARKALAEAKIGRPSDWLFSEQLIAVQLRLGNAEAAKQEARSALDKWPGRQSARIALAKVAMMERDPQAAVSILEELEDIDSSVEGLTVRGQAQLELGSVDQAQKDFDAALALRPRHRAAIVGRAQVDIVRDDASAAIGRLEPMYDKTAGPTLAVAYAAALRKSGKGKRAKDVLAPFVEGEAASVEALVELAHLERSLGRWEDARAAYARAIEAMPKSVDARLGAALLEIDDGKAAVGLEALEALYDEGRDSGQVLLALAKARIVTGKAEEAQELLEQAAERASWLGWNVARERGRAFLRRQKPIDAIAELQRAQNQRPEDAETRLLLMEAHLEASNRRGSAAATQDIVRSFRKSPLVSMAKGIHAFVENRGKDAILSFGEARRLYLDQKASKVELAKVAYWLGRAYELDGQLPQAVKWLSKATTLDSTQASAYYWLGQINFQEGKSKEMAANYRKSVELDPGNNPLAWYFLGLYLANEAKDKSQAADALESFLEYFPEESGDMVIEAKTILGQIR